MENKIIGLHHITVLASDPQKNYDFYTSVLGLRFIKKTINFDSPDVYHFYFADMKGTPGTVLTFFPFPGSRRGIRGDGEVQAIAYSIPAGSIEYWKDRLSRMNIAFDSSGKRFGIEYISFLDPDGMKIELFPDETADSIPGWTVGDVPAEHALRKFYGITMDSRAMGSSLNLLQDVMGLSLIGQEGKYTRLQVGETESAAWIDILEMSHSSFPVNGAGTVHHIAWRTSNEEEQLKWREKLVDSNMYVTEVRDRCYFKSIYYREPGGILYEIATDGPGFMIDEDIETLGEELKLPSWYESRRDEIEKNLIPIDTKNKISSL
jgi:glyoxalase family protein